MKPIGAALMATLCLAADARATLVIYSDRATFDAANPGLPIETFEEGNVDPQTTRGLFPPLDSTTNDSTFSPGDILPSVSFDVSPPGTLAIYGTGTFGLHIKTIAAGTFTSGLDIVFAEGASAVGFDVFNVEFSTSPITISIFGESGLLGQESVPALDNSNPDFFGVSSDMEPITRINLLDAENLFQGVEGVDNVAFNIVPEPSTALLLMLGLFALAARSPARGASSLDSRLPR